MTHKDQKTAVTSPWQQDSWDGPRVESRPQGEGAEWPEGAVERVTFTLQAFPDAAFPECLPFTEFFGSDGWPLRVPEEVKGKLDPRMQAEFRRYPWTYRPEEWQPRNWVKFAHSYEDFLYRQAEGGVARTVLRTAGLSGPCHLG